MAWNKNLPADNTKLRLAPGVIRDNNDALETGAVPFDAIQLQEQAASPPGGITPGASKGFFYGHPNNGQTEAFFVNSASIIRQLTGNGLSSGNVTASVQAYGTMYGITLPSGIILNFGMVTGQAAIPQAITFAVAMNNAQYAAFATPISTSVILQVTALNATGMTITGLIAPRTGYILAIGA